MKPIVICLFKKKSFLEEMWLNNHMQAGPFSQGCVDPSGTESAFWALLRVCLWLCVWLSHAHICCSRARCLPANKRLASEADVPDYGARLPGDWTRRALVCTSCWFLNTRAQTKDRCWSLSSSVTRLAEMVLFLGHLRRSWAQLKAAAVFITLF